MTPGLLFRFHARGPWRFGPVDGAARTGFIGHSDTLYAAFCQAMDWLGVLDEWLSVTARADVSAVRFSSCFPFSGDRLFVAPPRHSWPPAPSAKVRWSGAGLVPLDVAGALFAGGSPAEDRYVVDAGSTCLLPLERNIPVAPPFRFAQRSRAAVDRLDSGAVDVHRRECLEFSPNSGMWFAVGFEDEAAREQWSARVRSAARLLADSGLGGERSSGWGAVASVDIREGDIDSILLGERNSDESAGETAWWLLSLFSPAPSDTVDWHRGAYDLLPRSGAGTRSVRMVSEGSVLFAEDMPRGACPDVAPDGSPHPIYRCGTPLALRVPTRVQS